MNLQFAKINALSAEKYSSFGEEYKNGIWKELKELKNCLCKISLINHFYPPFYQDKICIQSIILDNFSRLKVFATSVVMG